MAEVQYRLKNNGEFDNGVCVNQKSLLLSKEEQRKQRDASKSMERNQDEDVNNVFQY